MRTTAILAALLLGGCVFGTDDRRGEGGEPRPSGCAPVCVRDKSDPFSNFEIACVDGQGEVCPGSVVVDSGGAGLCMCNMPRHPADTEKYWGCWRDGRLARLATTRRPPPEITCTRAIR